MTVEELVEEQERLAPKDDLSAYVGKWVALRAGLFVAVADDPVSLRELDEVRADDVLMAVTDPEAGYFL